MVEPAYAPQALPSFRRSTMDGYAVRAVDSYGASETLPAVLSVIGEVEMGKASQFPIGKYTAAVVHTGGMIPDIADAVVQIEHTQQVDPDNSIAYPFEIEVFKAVAVGQNVLQVEKMAPCSDQHHFWWLHRPEIDLTSKLDLNLTDCPFDCHTGTTCGRGMRMRARLPLSTDKCSITAPGICPRSAVRRCRPHRGRCNVKHPTRDGFSFRGSATTRSTTKLPQRNFLSYGGQVARRWQ